MKPSIANHGVKKNLIIDHQSERIHRKRSDNTLKIPIQELMTMNVTPIKSSTQDKKKEVRKT